MGRNYSIFNNIKRLGDKGNSPFPLTPAYRQQASPLHDEEREFFIGGGEFE
jgi:hypothetical protein